MGVIKAVCISKEKGTQKVNIHEAKVIEGFGLEDDAHGGNWHRQISLLSYEKIEDFKRRGAPVQDGSFGENLIVEGIELTMLPIGCKFKVGDEVILELTQIGKECHSGCEIYQIMGECIMPKNGVFTKIIKGGTIKEGDSIYVID